MRTLSAPEGNFLDDQSIGLGAWAWGDRVVWQYGRGYGHKDIREAFEVSMAEGIRLIDTAEIYGSGNSEQFLGQFVQANGRDAILATKFFPWPWRLSRKSLIRALTGSLERLGVKQVDLYQVHNPISPLGIEALSEALGDCVDAGLARHVGVSNFDEGQMLRAYSTLARRGIHLASNQVHYSLLHRQPEKAGLLKRCLELGIRLIAYSPLEMGLLTGKYSWSHPPPGSRALRYPSIIGRLQPLLRRMTEIGQDLGGKSNAQVALNWVIAKGAMPIPGAKTAAQAAENAGALGWALDEEQVAELDEISAQII